MDIYVLDGAFKKIGFPIDNYISCIWRIGFYDIGDCELYLNARPDVLSLLRTGAYLVRDKDIDAENTYYENVMEIESIKVETNEESGDHITVTGKDLKAILNQRIIFNGFKGTDVLFQDSLNKVFEENISNPANLNRKIDAALLFNETSHTEHLTVEEGQHDYVGDWMISQCKTCECGIIPYANTQKSPRAGMIDYFVKKVRDNENVIFSSQYIDISTSSYTKNTENRKNTAIVYGDEVDGVQIIETVNDDMPGNARYETYVSSSISSDDYYNNDQIIDKEGSYRSVLRSEGEKTLQDTKVEETFECDISSYGQFQLDRDFFLGDKVIVVNKYGIKARAVISQIIDTHDENGRTIIPTFSDFEVI